MQNLKLKLFGISIALLGILGAMLSLGISSYFHLEAALWVLAGVTSNALLASKEKTLARRVGEGAVYFGWLGLLIAWISIASNGFNALNAAELGVSTAYSLHPLLYGYVVKFISLSLDE
jgi:hypothetical protein